jgi:hypothetical protein
MFIPGIPIAVNQNTHQGLKLVNGARYTALDVILDKVHPGHRINADTILHFDPPAGILLAAGTTREFLYVQLSRCPSLDGILLLSEARETDSISC